MYHAVVGVKTDRNNRTSKPVFTPEIRESMMQYPDLPDHMIEEPDKEWEESKKIRRENRRLDEYLNELDRERYDYERDLSR